VHINRNKHKAISVPDLHSVIGITVNKRTNETVLKGAKGNYWTENGKNVTLSLPRHPAQNSVAYQTWKTQISRLYLQYTLFHQLLRAAWDRSMSLQYIQAFHTAKSSQESKWD